MWDVVPSLPSNGLTFGSRRPRPVAVVDPMVRVVSARLELRVDSPIDLVLSIAPAAALGIRVDETFALTLEGRPVAHHEIIDDHGTRSNRAQVEPGLLTVTYDATVHGRALAQPAEEHDLISFLRPSRYCESDSLAPTALAQFGGLRGMELLDAVSSWVGTHLAYVSGSSLSTDGALRTLLARQGVCRDYAHLCISMLRACGVPARAVSVYAPGLDPMDFHAVCEAYIGGRWLVIDPTTKAPRGSMLRIATGRDAADTAFLTTLSGSATLTELEVTATVDELPTDDLTRSVQLG